MGWIVTLSRKRSINKYFISQFIERNCYKKKGMHFHASLLYVDIQLFTINIKGMDYTWNYT